MNRAKLNNLKVVFLFLLAMNIYSSHAQYNNDLEIKTQRNEDNSVDFTYIKKLPGSYFVTITFSTLTNTVHSGTLKTVVKSSSGTFFTLKPLDNKKGIGYSYKYSFIMGNPKAKVDSKFVYLLPFKEGTNIRVQETNNLGEKYFGSERPENWKAYIVKTKSPKPVFAMRKGLVVKIVNDYGTVTQEGTSYTGKMNSITIEHKDGTLARYQGFKQNSFKVKLGQTVYPNMELGMLDTFANEGSRLYFYVYYLSIDNFDHTKKENLTNRKSKSAYINPYFFTEDGAFQIENGATYNVKWNKDTLFSEFSKREKKKYAKDPSQFQ